MSKMEDTMSNIKKTIENTVGLSGKEADIYLSLLELGEGTVIDIAKCADLKRTTVYNSIPSLLEQGLINKTVRAKHTFYFIEDVRVLEHLLVDKHSLLSKIIPQLQDLQTITSLKPKITFFEGAGGFKEMIFDLFKECKAGDEVLSFIGSEKFYETLPTGFADEYWKKRVGAKISTRVLSPRFADSEDMARRAVEHLRKIKLIDDSEFSFQAGIEIYGNKISIASYKENFMGVIIESREISHMMRGIFNLMWRVLPG